jgi:hypothetical protein
MATGKKDGDREAELEAAIEAIRVATWKAGADSAAPAPMCRAFGANNLASSDFNSVWTSLCYYIGCLVFRRARTLQILKS